MNLKVKEFMTRSESFTAEWKLITFLETNRLLSHNMGIPATLELSLEKESKHVPVQKRFWGIGPYLKELIPVNHNFLSASLAYTEPREFVHLYQDLQRISSAAELDFLKWGIHECFLDLTEYPGPWEVLFGPTPDQHQEEVTATAFFEIDDTGPNHVDKSLLGICCDKVLLSEKMGGGYKIRTGTRAMNANVPLLALEKRFTAFHEDELAGFFEFAGKMVSDRRLLSSSGNPRYVVDLLQGGFRSTPRGKQFEYPFLDIAVTLPLDFTDQKGHNVLAKLYYTSEEV